jgi:hypothetical protein
MGNNISVDTGGSSTGSPSGPAGDTGSQRWATMLQIIKKNSPGGNTAGPWNENLPHIKWLTGELPPIEPGARTQYNETPRPGPDYPFTLQPIQKLPTETGAPNSAFLRYADHNGKLVEKEWRQPPLQMDKNGYVKKSE